MKNHPTTLFYTCVNEKFWSFGLIYPIFVLNSNPHSIVEIGVENVMHFKHKFRHILDFYKKNYPGRVVFRGVDFTKQGLFRTKKIVPNTVRFITTPKSKADYVYIGDADVFITEDITLRHLENIKQNNLDYSNIVRPGKERLSGLHFIEYKKMYPLPSLKGLKLEKQNDEEVLYRLMERKGLKIPGPEIKFRPTHGLHISFYSCPPFETMTTQDQVVNFPGWLSLKNSPHNVSAEDPNEAVNRYLKIRYSEPIKAFFSILKPKNVEIRKVIQITDAVCYYYQNAIPEEMK